MQPFLSHTGIGVPLLRSNVDTDQIIPAVFLKRIARTGFDDGLFFSWRQNPEFVLNQPEFSRGSILVAGPDFGTGSSREHAVWALLDYGFRVVLSSRFADIFRGNAGKAGLLAAQMEQSDIELLWKLLDAQPGISLTVDLKTRQVRCSEYVWEFHVDDYTRWRLMEGLDDISLTLRDEKLIADYEMRRPTFLPRIDSRVSEHPQRSGFGLS